MSVGLRFDSHRLVIGLGLSLVSACASARSGPATSAMSAAPSCSPAARDSVYTEAEVDSAVIPLGRLPSPQPSQALLSVWQPQRAVVRFVVDTGGLAERCTVAVREATHEDWAAAVRAVVPQYQFRPAVRGGRKVRQWAEITVTWRPGR